MTESRQDISTVIDDLFKEQAVTTGLAFCPIILHSGKHVNLRLVFIKEEYLKVYPLVLIERFLCLSEYLNIGLLLPCIEVWK